jgi:hypothetical protein
LIAAGGGGGSGDLVCPDAGGGGNPFGGSGSPGGGCVGGGAGANGDGTTGSGQLGQGSAGGDPVFLAGPGGGGGGGYYGGGGGAAGLAGGGGSSFGPPDTVYYGADHGGDGVAIVTFGGSVPTVVGLKPNAGAVGDTISVVGTNLSVAGGTTTVTFGGGAAVPATCGAPPATSCSVTVPQGSGTLKAHVNVGGQQSLDTDAAAFTYVGPAAITAITPAAGPSGTAVTVAGSGLVPGSVAFRFGAQVATIKSCTAYDSCIVEVPAGLDAGPLEVFARSAGAPGDTNSVPFTVLPGITTIAPSRGPAAGKTVVTITGSGFSATAGAVGVTFGGVPATAIGCANATTCTAVSPAGSGKVPVRVTLQGLESPDGADDDFTYLTGEEQPAPAPALMVPFGMGGDDIGPAAEAPLQAALAAIQGAPPESPVLVEGHADSAGDDAYNDALSLRRAQAVAAWLGQAGVDVARMAIVARGESAPLAPEDTPDGRAHHRSVVIMVEPAPA